jgi:amino acid adenylation domain-containing protein
MSEGTLQSVSLNRGGPSICRAFGQQVENNPSAVAIESGATTLTYRQLDNQSNQFARYLRDRGVTRATPVGLCLERSFDLVVAIVGILKAGGAYVPIDPTFPAARIEQLIEDCAPLLIVTGSGLVHNIAPRNSRPLIQMDLVAGAISQECGDTLTGGPEAGDLAYIMYTSGSTGTPKGVMVEHRAVVRLVKDTNYAVLDRGETFLQLAPISFDASTFEIWAPLLNGGRLVMFPPGVPGLDAIAKAISDYHVTTLWLTAGLFNRMVERCVDGLRPLRQLLAGGEVLSASHIRRVLEHCPELRVINGYGPTESTTFACCHSMTRHDPVPDPVPIGRPISRTQIFLLDEHLRIVPHGDRGELCIGGDGLARGYLNQPTLTAEKFIPNPFGEPGSRLYKTGDLARYRPDGLLEFLGRADDQVKISGHRVEPGEIVTCLRSHPTVQDAVVLAIEDIRGRKLKAYIVARVSQGISESGLRAYLLSKLPAYMVPSDIALVDELPLTANGKADRLALLLAGKVAPRMEAAKPLRSGSESLVSDVWQRVLGVDCISTSKNFFDLGGDSLQLIEVHSELIRHGFHDLSITDLFAYPTIHELALLLDKAAPTPPPIAEMRGRATLRKAARERLGAIRAGSPSTRQPHAE